MAGSESHPDLDAAIAGLALDSDRAVELWIGRVPALRTEVGLLRLAEGVTTRLRVDLDQAERLAQAAAILLPLVESDRAKGRVLRATGHVHALRSRFPAALADYERALEAFERGGSSVEAAITRSGALQTLIYLGRYEDALMWAERARAVFTAEGDTLRLARLESNIGNIRYRRDDVDGARLHYKRALSAFRDGGEAQDMAIVLRNLAVCYIVQYDFERAIETYRDARAWCEGRGLTGLMAEIDYSTAYLFYLRGEYGQAIELYRVARERCVASGDRYHAALCDLDQSELYLEINLVSEGLALAWRAEAGFAGLGLRFERGKAMVNAAVAEHQRRRPRAADRRFRRARRLLIQEPSPVWPALIDLYRALNLEEARPTIAERLARRARGVFARTALVSKQAVCELLLARLQLKRGRLAEAQTLGLEALTRVESVGVPAIAYQAAFTLGVVAEADGRGVDGYEWYRRAHTTLEQLRGHLRHDELKIAFLSDKQAVFEHLVASSLLHGHDGAAETFAWIEQAKSRNLSDQVARQVRALPLPSSSRPEVGSRLRSVRERLHWCYREIERAELAPPGRDQSASVDLSRLRRDAQQCESELVRQYQSLDEPLEEYVALHTATVAPVEAVRQALPADGALLEYYEARGGLHVALLTHDDLVVVPLGAAEDLRPHLEFLRLQLSKFRLDPTYLRQFAKQLERATLGHLRTIHARLVAPLRSRLEGKRHLIVVPHHQLHYLPFHALHDGSRYLIDEFAVSYAPSATVLHYCRQKPPGTGQTALVLGVTDPALPSIPDEARAVAAALPGATVLIGDSATDARLREDGATARVVHIATHGRFRSDNPLFSSIRLADRDLTLFDLYQLRLSADLVTLSGCVTGLNVVAAGDELIGLTRGLLFAGARAVLVSLWEVHDQATAGLMAGFYARQSAGEPSAEALAAAMRDVRERFPHPYYWAPFVLVGDFGRTGARPSA
ncbi:MAG: CHAT domain-containing protein [Vicinamibacterales bacterium]